MKAQILLDFDITHSIIPNKGQGYILKPVIDIATIEEIPAPELLIEQPLGESYTSVIDGKLVSYEIRDGLLVTEGDIIIGEVAGEFSSKSIRRSGNEFLWPGGIMPFTLDASFTAAERESIFAAMREWEQQCADPNVRFVQRSNENDFVHFLRGAEGTGCSSWVGRIGGGRSLIWSRRAP
jgi:Astacin (Peptidase family M12A)